MIQHSDTPILERPYSDRQLIFVTDDTVLSAARAKISSHKSKGTFTEDWAKLRKAVKDRELKDIAISGTRLAVGPAILAAAGLVGAPALGPVAVAVWASLSALEKLSDKGIKILPIGRTEAMTLTFPPGHPRDDVLYIGHPAVPAIYSPMADFHRITFEHKFSQAVLLLMSLGATRLRVEHVSGWSKEFSARLVVPLGSAEEVATIGSQTNSTNRSKLLYVASFHGTSDPVIPKGLVWYPHEPTWQSVAIGRTQHRLKDFSLAVKYDRSRATP
jgi:hypothetical protein